MTPEACKGLKEAVENDNKDDIFMEGYTWGIHDLSIELLLKML